MSDGHPLISVVVPFRNRVEEVIACARSLRRQTLPRDQYEILLVNNNSTDDLTAIERLNFVRLIHCGRHGASAARNEGIQAARGKVVAFIDSDCIARADWLEKLTAPLLNDARIKGAGGRLVGRHMDNGVAFFTQVYGIIDQRKLFRGVAYYPPFLVTANAAWRREDLLRVRGFDEMLWPCEDADLSWRVMDAGGSLVYVHEAMVSHRHRETFRALFRQAREYGGSSAKLYEKHRGKFGGGLRVDWIPWMRLALQPFFAIEQLLFERRRVFRQWFIYESVWLTGFLIGRVWEAMRLRVLFF